MENECVRRGAAEQVICEACERPGCPILWGDDCDIIARLNTIPAADVVEVVRCKDCKEYQANHRWCGFIKINIAPDEFCSYGERREPND